MSHENTPQASFNETRRVPVFARSRQACPLENVLLHRRVTPSGSRRSGRIAVILGVAVPKVVGHFRVKLLCCLLDRPVTAAAPRGLLASLASRGVLSVLGILLHRCRRLGLSLGLRNALSKRLGLRDEFGRSDDNLNLIRS